MEFSKIDCIKDSNSKSQLTIAAGPVIINDSKVILTREEKDDYWKFPGGKVRDGESFIETVMREALEEAGLKVEVFGDPIAYLLENEEKGINYLLIHYGAMVLDTLSSGSDDSIAESKWFDINNIEVNVAPNVKPILNIFANM